MLHHWGLPEAGYRNPKSQEKGGGGCFTKYMVAKYFFGYSSQMSVFIEDSFSCRFMSCLNSSYESIQLVRRLLYTHQAIVRLTILLIVNTYILKTMTTRRIYALQKLDSPFSTSVWGLKLERPGYPTTTIKVQKNDFLAPWPFEIHPPYACTTGTSSASPMENLRRPLRLSVF